jgi:type 1 glutamine amidotransferase
MRNLLIAGGLYHPMENCVPSLTDTFDRMGMVTDVEEDVEAGCRKLSEGSYDLLTVSAIRWRMLNDAKYEPHRARWALSISEHAREAIRAHLHAGRPLFAMHAAAICFDDWPEWGEILGGRWVWGQSGHPPFGAVDVRFHAGSGSALTAGLAPFNCDDEVYGGLWIAPDVKPLAEARLAVGSDGMPGAWMPVLWTRQWRGGRVVYDALGHDAASLEHPVHRRLVTRAALWALGRPDEEVIKA